MGEFTTPGMLQDGMIGVKSCADCQSFVARRGLNIGSAKRSSVEELPIRNAVQRATPSHGQLLYRHTLMKLVEQVKEYFLEDVLHRVGKIHVALSNLSMRFTRRPKQFLHLPGEVRRKLDGSIFQHLHALVTAQGLEIVKIEMEIPVLEADNLGNVAAICVFAVRSQPHHLAFIPVLPVSDEFANHGVKAAE